jgi:hypothetical protein
MNDQTKNKEATEKGKQPEVQDKQDEQRVKTVTPDNENGDPGPPADQESSNKGKGPKGEDL